MAMDDSQHFADQDTSASSMIFAWTEQAGPLYCGSSETSSFQPSNTGQHLRPTSLPAVQSSATTDAQCSGPRQSLESTRSAPLSNTARTSTSSAYSRPDQYLTPTETPETSTPSSTTQRRSIDKSTNKFVCSHCPETFSKSADQRKHFQKSCKSLGPGGYEAYLCKTCGDITPTRAQSEKHQKDVHNNKDFKSSCEKLNLPTRRCFTCCCSGGKVFTTMEEFHKHAKSRSSNCNIVGADHRFRLCTLLEQGKAANPAGHEGLYAELLNTCRSRHLLESDLRDLILGSSLDACELANKLEWGQADCDRLLRNGLAFESNRKAIEAIFAQLDSMGTTDQGARADQGSQYATDAQAPNDRQISPKPVSGSSFLELASSPDVLSNNMAISVWSAGLTPELACEVPPVAYPKPYYARPINPIVALGYPNDVVWSEIPLVQQDKQYTSRRNLISQALEGNAMATSTSNAQSERQKQSGVPTRRQRPPVSTMSTTGTSRKRPISIYGSVHPDSTARSESRQRPVDKYQWTSQNTLDESMDLDEHEFEALMSSISDDGLWDEGFQQFQTNGFPL